LQGHCLSHPPHPLKSRSSYTVSEFSTKCCGGLGMTCFLNCRHELIEVTTLQSTAPGNC
ncbi:hypothetical protein J6590_003688, partial [Homalodisca vitripennis]